MKIDIIRKITEVTENTAISRLSLFAKSAALVGTALLIGFLILEAEGALQQEFLKALSVALGACIIALIHKPSTN